MPKYRTWADLQKKFLWMFGKLPPVHYTCPMSDTQTRLLGGRQINELTGLFRNIEWVGVRLS